VRSTLFDQNSSQETLYFYGSSSATCHHDNQSRDTFITVPLKIIKIVCRLVEEVEEIEDTVRRLEQKVNTVFLGYTREKGDWTWGGLKTCYVMKCCIDDICWF
jgi:hypothetical protein